MRKEAEDIASGRFDFGELGGFCIGDFIISDFVLGLVRFFTSGAYMV